jgi:hypothetical protein
MAMFNNQMGTVTIPIAGGGAATDRGYRSSKASLGAWEGGVLGPVGSRWRRPEQKWPGHLVTIHIIFVPKFDAQMETIKITYKF